MSEVPGLTVDVDILRIEARATLSEGLSEDRAQCHKQPHGLTWAHTACGCLRVNAGTPERLISINVADPTDQGLVKQGLLYGRAPSAQRSKKRRIIKSQFERIGRNVRHLTRHRPDHVAVFTIRNACTDCAALRHQTVKRKRTKESLIRKIHPKFPVLWVLKPQANSYVTIIVRIRRAQEQLPAHTQMSEQGELPVGLCTRISCCTRSSLDTGLFTGPFTWCSDRYPQKFSPSQRGFQHCSTQAAFEVSCALCAGLEGQGHPVATRPGGVTQRHMTLKRTRISHINGSHACPGNRWGKPLPHDFNLWEFRHRSSPSAATRRLLRP